MKINKLIICLLLCIIAISFARDYKTTEDVDSTFFSEKLYNQYEPVESSICGSGESVVADFEGWDIPEFMESFVKDTNDVPAIKRNCGRFEVYYNADFFKKEYIGERREGELLTMPVKVCESSNLAMAGRSVIISLEVQPSEPLQFFVIGQEKREGSCCPGNDFVGEFFAGFGDSLLPAKRCISGQVSIRLPTPLTQDKCSFNSEFGGSNYYMWSENGKYDFRLHAVSACYFDIDRFPEAKTDRVSLLDSGVFQVKPSVTCSVGSKTDTIRRCTTDNKIKETTGVVDWISAGECGIREEWTIISDCAAVNAKCEYIDNEPSCIKTDSETGEKEEVTGYVAV